MSVKNYAPFALVAAALMILVLVAPSKPPTAAASPFNTFAGSSTGDSQAQSSGAAAPSQGPSGAAAAAVPGTTTAGHTVFGGATTGVSPVTGRKAGDTSHCYQRPGYSQAQQFKEFVTAPPCTPTWVGNNGGATWPGVTATTINILYYREKDSPAVQGIEQAANVYSSPSDQQAFIQAAIPFINSHYELYGRKVNIQFYQGSCNPSPPDPNCYHNDADAIAALNPKPFMVIYENDTNEPDFFDELARNQIISWGGWHFDDQFNLQERPWHYDVYMSGDLQAVLTAEWWCKKLAKKPAQFAGAPDPGTTDLRTQTRKVAVVVAGYSVEEEPAVHLTSLINQCAPNSAETITYASDTTTATQQATTQVNKMQSDGITSVLWFSDPIAPVYGLPAQQSQKFYPEEVLVGSGLLDYDVFGQLYQQSAPKEWIHAFGPSDLGNSIPFNQTDANVVWHEDPNTSGDVYAGANLPWSYFSTIANILNQTGPNLNPGTFEKAAFGGPFVSFWNAFKDPVHVYGKFGPDPNAIGAYAAISDEREVYWDPNVTSPINGKKGEYIGINGGQRYQIGGWGGSGPNLPPGQ